MLEGAIPYRPEDARKYNKFRWWPGLTMSDLLDRAADVYPNREALVDSNARYTYSQLREKVNRVAISLMGLGIKPKDRVLVQLPNWSEFVYCYWAVQKIGAIAVLLISRYAQTEVNHLAKLTGAVAWIVPEKHRSMNYLSIIEDVLKANPALQHVILVRASGAAKFPRVEDLIENATVTPASLKKLAARRPDPMEVAHMGPTGGSTGLPKVAPRTHNSYVARAIFTGLAWEICGEDTCLLVAPIGHDLPFSVGLVPSLVAMGKVVMLDSGEPADILSTIQKEKVTAIPWVPALTDRVVYYENLKDYDVSSLKKIYNGGQASPAKLIKDVNEKLGCKYVNAYGGTEGQHTMIRLDFPQEQAHTTVGKPICPYDIYKTVDSDFKQVAPGTPGELVIKGPCVITGYYNAPEENAKAFTPDGFFRTGDLAIISDDGYITLTGRIKDIIKRGGENISPVEIEELIIAHPDVAQVSVIGMPDPVMTERICAYIQPKPGARLDFACVISYLKGKGASVLQLPERCEFMDSLPLTAAGKPDKKPLREDIRQKLVKEGKLKV